MHMVYLFLFKLFITLFLIHHTGFVFIPLGFSFEIIGLFENREYTVFLLKLCVVGFTMRRMSVLAYITLLL